MPIRLYLDTNVFCRPFDNQNLRRVRNETAAFERVLEKIKDRTAVLVTSEILLFEIDRILSPTKKAKVTAYMSLSGGYHGLTEETLLVAEWIRLNFRLDPRDALHVASALLQDCRYFLSCDDGITKRFRKQPLSVTITDEKKAVEILNPVDFLTQIGW